MDTLCEKRGADATAGKLKPRGEHFNSDFALKSHSKPNACVMVSEQIIYDY